MSSEHTNSAAVSSDFTREQTCAFTESYVTWEILLKVFEFQEKEAKVWNSISRRVASSVCPDAKYGHFFNSGCY